MTIGSIKISLSKSKAYFSEQNKDNCQKMEIHSSKCLCPRETQMEMIRMKLFSDKVSQSIG